MNNNIDIEFLARESLNYIKSNYKIPNSGFLAGGSISNLIWEKVSGNKAVINDIDIYKLDSVIPKEDIKNIDKKRYQRYENKSSLVIEDYSGYAQNHHFTKDIYIIIDVGRDGYLNNITYKSNKDSYDIILESFDINCCQMGYNIEKDEFLWTPEFEEFIKTGDLKITNLTTPAHTAIRLAKKEKELNANLDEIEMDMVEYSIHHCFFDILKLKFKERYANMYQKYESKLSERFKLVRDKDTEYWLKNINVNNTDKIWKLQPSNPKPDAYTLSTKFDRDWSKIHKTTDLIYYVRNIYGNKKLEYLWNKLKDIFDIGSGSLDYIDTDINESDLKLITKWIEVSPASINNLRGYKLSEQLNIIKGLMNKYKEDIIVGISILSNHKISEIDLDDDFGMLMLELSVRKQILDDPTRKAKRIFETQEDIPSF